MAAEPAPKRFIQRALTEYNRGAPSNKDIHVKIGIDVGEVSIKGGEVSGEAVAVALRVAQVSNEKEAEGWDHFIVSRRC